MGRGDRDGSFGRGSVDNGGLWWPELKLEAVGKLVVTLQTTMDAASVFASDGGYDSGVKSAMMVTKWWQQGGRSQSLQTAPRERERNEFSSFRERETKNAKSLLISIPMRFFVFIFT